MGLFDFFSSGSLSPDETVIFSKIRPVIADHLAIDPSEVLPSSSLDDLGCDELDIPELFIAFFDVGYPSPPNAEKGVRTVRDIVRALKKYQ